MNVRTALSMDPAPASTEFGDVADPEMAIARDLVRRGLPVAPAIVLLSGLVWGWPGFWSAAIGFGVVLVNFLVAAALLTWAARISLTMIMAVTLGGFIGRMAVITAVLFVLKDQPWAALAPLGLTIAVTHLGLLVWETRYVSLSLAYPALKPAERGA